MAEPERGVLQEPSSVEQGVKLLKDNTRPRVSFAQCAPPLGAAGAASVAAALKTKGSACTWLVLFNQEIGEDGAGAICQALQSHKSILHLDLGRNQIGDAGAHAVADLIKHSKTLEEVYLWDNGITDEGAHALESALKTNRSIKIIDLNDNHVASEIKSNIQALLKMGPARAPASPRLGPS